MPPEFAAEAESVRVPGLSRAVGVMLTGTALMLGAWIVLHLWAFGRSQIIDTPVYRGYGEALLDRQAPYRDFGLEYPPGSLPAFALPATRAETLLEYRYWFDGLMLLCAICISGLISATLTAMGASRRRLYLTTAVVPLALLGLGSVVYSRFDLWPALFVSAAVAFLVTGPALAAFVALGLAIAAKLYAVVLLPLALSFIWRTRGKGEALRGVGACAVVVAAAFAPFVALAPAGVWDSLHRQAQRPLQLESLGSAVLLTMHQLGAYTPSVVKTFGSDNLAGSFPDVIATVLLALQALAVVAVWMLFRRGEPRPDRLILAATAALTALVAFGKVLSPQFLIWLIPLVALLPGPTGRWALALLGTALIATQIWFPHHYWALRDLGAISWLVLFRDLLLVTLFALLATSLGRAIPSQARLSRR